MRLGKVRSKNAAILRLHLERPLRSTVDRHLRKVWVSIKFFSAKFGFSPGFTPPPSPGKGPKCGKSSKLTLFLGGVEAILWTKRFYGHLGVSEQPSKSHVKRALLLAHSVFFPSQMMGGEEMGLTSAKLCLTSYVW